MQKYKTGGEISARVLNHVKELAVDGAKIFDICEAGDKLLEQELSKIYNSKKASKISKGIAFPTTVNPNQFPAHIAPSSQDDETNFTLKNGDVVNIMLGVQIDGFPAIIAETKVVGESETAPVEGLKADLLHSAWTASEAAIRQFKPNGRNWDVTNIVDKVAKIYNTTAVESMLSHNQERNVLYGPKEILLNPTKESKNKLDTFRFEENEVYGLDILISTSNDGKVKLSNFKTSLYKLTGDSYGLKLKSSHQALGEFKQKASGLFPLNIKKFADVRKTRMGLIECVNHKVLLSYDIMTEKEGEFIAQYFTTFGITKNGIVKYTSPSFNPKLYATDKKIEDEELLKLLSEPLKISKKKNKKESK